MQTQTSQFLTPVHIEAFDTFATRKPRPSGRGSKGSLSINPEPVEWVDLDDAWFQYARTLKNFFNADKRKSNADYADKFNLRPSAFRDV